MESVCVVTFFGPTASGKTAFIHLIQDACESLGKSCNVYDDHVLATKDKKFKEKYAMCKEHAAKTKPDFALVAVMHSGEFKIVVEPEYMVREVVKLFTRFPPIYKNLGKSENQGN